MKSVERVKGFIITVTSEKRVLDIAMAYSNAGIKVKRQGKRGIEATFPKGLPVSQKAELLKRAEIVGTPVVF